MELARALSARYQCALGNRARHCGAGGIGQSLYENIRSFVYADTAAILVIVIITIVIMDMISSALRRMLV